MNRTYIAKDIGAASKWYIVDAAGKTLGRLATRVADILHGKHKPDFTPHVDTGDHVVVINASRIKVTGRKLEQKFYKRYSGYPHGLRQRRMDDVMANDPEFVIRHAVRGMLPRNTIGTRAIKKLKIYSGTEHPHIGQNPQSLTIE